MSAFPSTSDQAALDAADLTWADVRHLCAAGASLEQAISIVQARSGTGRASSTLHALDRLRYDEDLLNLGVGPAKVVAWAQAGLDTTNAVLPGPRNDSPVDPHAVTMLLDAGLNGHQVYSVRIAGLDTQAAVDLVEILGPDRISGAIVQAVASGVAPADVAWLFDTAGMELLDFSPAIRLDLLTVDQVPDDQARRAGLLLAMAGELAVPAAVAKGISLMLAGRQDASVILDLLVARVGFDEAVALAGLLQGRSKPVVDLTVGLVRDGMSPDDALAAALADELIQAAASRRTASNPGEFVRMPARWVHPRQVAKFLSHDGTVNDEEYQQPGTYLEALADSLESTGFSEESPVLLSVDPHTKRASVLDGNHRLILLLSDGVDLPGVWVPVVVTDEPGTDPGVPYDGRFGWPKTRGVHVSRAAVQESRGR